MEHFLPILNKNAPTEHVFWRWARTRGFIIWIMHRGIFHVSKWRVWAKGQRSVESLTSSAHVAYILYTMPPAAYGSIWWRGQSTVKSCLTRYVTHLGDGSQIVPALSVVSLLVQSCVSSARRARSSLSSTAERRLAPAEHHQHQHHQQQQQQQRNDPLCFTAWRASFWGGPPSHTKEKPSFFFL